MTLTNEKTPILAVRDLKKSFDGNLILKGISLDVYKGDVIAILSGSGGGKSTFLRCLNLLETPDSGKVYFHGYDLVHQKLKLNKLRTKMGMVFQSFNLFNNMSVIGNVNYAQIRVLHRLPTTAIKCSKEALKKVGLEGKEKNRVSSLSGGQKQRVAIARAMVMEPDIMLFDEPTSALDPLMVEEVFKVIHELAESGMTMLLVTHDMNFARKVSNRVVFLDKGFICEVSSNPNDFFTNAKTPQARNFLGLDKKED